MIKLKDLLEAAKTGKSFHKIVYRGDDKAFTEFDPAQIGRKGYKTVGFWFSETKDAAAFYGEHVRPFKITMQNPKVFSRDDFIKVYPESPPYLAQIAKNEGYDGVIITDIMDGDRFATVYCVFSPSQIKPVTGAKHS